MIISGLKMLRQVHEPDPQPARQLSHRLVVPRDELSSQPGHRAPGEPAPFPKPDRRPRVHRAVPGPAAA